MKSVSCVRMVCRHPDGRERGRRNRSIITASLRTDKAVEESAHENMLVWS